MTDFTSDAILVDDTFIASNIIKEPKYVRTWRVILNNETLSIEIDINFDLFPMEQDKKYQVILTQSFLPEYKKSFSYAMYGKIFKIDLEQDQYQSIYISYGGLVMKMRGKLNDMSQSIKNETRCYILLRQI
ncbi:RNA polymerase rpb8 (macronuclear) [Tetrahymena thermophila SB210]|uniref:RNA polymerase rpb8 n=1 Tax=Tetrahymena thermophila (strain SB210) TaxID=312017 RepID=I7MA57_TETTS|nr:RNA polymerase rpb8 [Tetrahymena thermophila SB210]EAS03759.1 RNA polymerase rpb8 [Tetrahymena thermophila SB210]|eukprot:XP_001024004.1 RNA polymerase rpb8 [Tetrahymena thermophila SB210]